MQNDAHIQTAFRAAFEFGRQSYCADPDFSDYDVSNALAKYREWQGESSNQQPDPAPETEKPAPVVGGGATMTGRILWLLESRGPLPVCPVWSKNAPSCILEVGNVLSNFMPCNHVVVDKFEKASGVLNVDIVDYRSTRKFDFIISISTFEHIGFDDEKDVTGSKIQKAIDHCRSLLTNDGRMVITVPLGYNPAIDEMLRRSELGAFRSTYLQAENGKDWCEIVRTVALDTYKSRNGNWPHANTIAVLEFEAHGRAHADVNAAGKPQNKAESPNNPAQTNK